MDSPLIQSASLIETACAIVELAPNGILYVRIKEDAQINIDEVDAIDNAIISLSGGAPCFILVIPGVGSNADNEARQHAANRRKEKRIVAEAIVVSNLPLRMLANFYIRFNKPKQKVKVFSSEEDGLEWLLAIKNAC
jgi:hypothetical protein